MKVYWISTLFATSFETLHLTFNLLECGSVQINPQSSSLTYFKPFIFLKQSERRSLDSNSHATHFSLYHLLQNLQ